MRRLAWEWTLVGSGLVVLAVSALGRLSSGLEATGLAVGTAIVWAGVRLSISR
jgi:hypothetical protein